MALQNIYNYFVILHHSFNRSRLTNTFPLCACAVMYETKQTNHGVMLIALAQIFPQSLRKTATVEMANSTGVLH